jgi:hypothetical protein
VGGLRRASGGENCGKSAAYNARATIEFMFIPAIYHSGAALDWKKTTLFDQ